MTSKRYPIWQFLLQEEFSTLLFQKRCEPGKRLTSHQTAWDMGWAWVWSQLPTFLTYYLYNIIMK